MRNSLLYESVAVLCSVLIGGVAVGDEAKKDFVAPAEPTAEAVEVTVDLPVFSAYVARGQVVNDEPVLQPALTVVKGDLTIGLWGNFNLTDKVTEDSLELSEVDVTLSYGHQFGAVGLSGGVIEYAFPNQTVVVEGENELAGRGRACPGSREFFLTVTAPDLAVVPSLSIYRDFDEVDATYLTAGVAWTHEFGEKIGMTLGCSVGYADAEYNNCLFGVDKAGWNDGNISLAFAWTATDSLTITPNLQYTMLLDNEIRDGSKSVYLDDSSLWGGVKFSWGL